jgi:hypothetical protein
MAGIADSGGMHKYASGSGMYLKPFLKEQDAGAGWEALGAGGPTIMGLAMLCGRVLASGVSDPPELTPEAKAILVAARQRGLMEIKGADTAFESPERLLAVHVETEAERGLVFRDRSHPEFTIRFLEAFRLLCESGLVLHQLYREFSLSQRGFETARGLSADEVQPLLQQAVAYG